MTDDLTRPIETPAPGTAAVPMNQVTAAPSVGLTRGRLVVAAGVVAAVVALTVGAFVLFGGPSMPEALKYIPNDAAIVAELRMDLPGDQLQKTGNLLAHFPGFLDQATLPEKLDEAFTKMVTEATEGSADYRTDIKPWLNGPAFIGVVAPEGGVAALADDKDELRHAVLSATTNNGVDCATTFKGQAVTHQPHGSFDLTISADGRLACVVDGRQALLGDPATVGKALDAKAAATGMDRSERYRAARSALGGERIATVFVNGAAMRDVLPRPSELPGGLTGIPQLEVFGSAIPDWSMVGIRAEDDAFVVDTVASTAPAASPDPSAASQLPLPPTHASLIAPLVPADTLVFAENQGSGVAIQNTMSKLRSIPELSGPMAMLDSAGGAGGFFGWIEDAGVAVSMSGEEHQVAAILVAADEKAANTQLARLSGMLGLLGLRGGVTQETSTVAGVTVTTFTIADLGAVVPPGSVPGAEIPSTGPISFSMAARGRTVLISSTPAAMAGVLGVQPGQSLADQAAFKLATQRGLSGSRTSVYVAAGAAFDLAKPLLGADEAAKWDEYAPYLEPIEAVGVTTTTDGAAHRSRVVITVTQTQPNQ